MKKNLVQKLMDESSIKFIMDDSFVNGMIGAVLSDDVSVIFPDTDSTWKMMPKLTRWMAMIVCAIYFCIPAESREQFHDLQGGGLINSLEI